jgi:hypothetical protein
MKKQLFVLLGLGLLFATASAYAQTAALKANIPFNFIVTGKSLPAGEYTIQSVSTSDRVLVIRGADKSANMVMANACESARPSDKTKLVFHRYGDRYFLSQIWTAGNSSGAELPQSRRETEVAMDFPRQDVVLIASR